MYNQIRGQTYKLLGVLGIPSAAAAVVIQLAYNRRQQQQQQSSHPHQWWWLRHARARAVIGDGIDIRYVYDVCHKSIVMCTQIIADIADEERYGNYGTGFRLTRSGDDDLLMITNAHTVQGCPIVLIDVYYQNQWLELYGRSVYVEQHLDLALVQLVVAANTRDDDYGVYKPQSFALANDRVLASDKLGDEIVAYGHGDIDHTVHPGIVLATGMPMNTVSLSVGDYHVLLVTVATDQQVVVHSGHLFSGFSGGPLIDNQLNIVGVNCFRGLYNRQFSIPFRYCNANTPTHTPLPHISIIFCFVYVIVVHIIHMYYEYS
ncbi:uncharacterized protein LOC128956396 isoform X1 [Oppia nitens]|uniref:uncharacterized protein LOC128956396 isoform X1 n=1 Tax=Oppia nitens TaxID=1686743 RepID=UPI0023DB277E|nr:uncharacterized protein LOC128956396 isoform X1 [Oppia nitens]